MFLVLDAPLPLARACREWPGIDACVHDADGTTAGTGAISTDPAYSAQHGFSFGYLSLGEDGLCGLTAEPVQAPNNNAMLLLEACLILWLAGENNTTRSLFDTYGQRYQSMILLPSIIFLKVKPFEI